MEEQNKKNPKKILQYGLIGLAVFFILILAGLLISRVTTNNLISQTSKGQGPIAAAEQNIKKNKSKKDTGENLNANNKVNKGTKWVLDNMPKKAPSNPSDTIRVGSEDKNFSATIRDMKYLDDQAYITLYFQNTTGYSVDSDKIFTLVATQGDKNLKTAKPNDVIIKSKQANEIIHTGPSIIPNNRGVYRTFTFNMKSDKDMIETMLIRTDQKKTKNPRSYASVIFHI